MKLTFSHHRPGTVDVSGLLRSTAVADGADPRDHIVVGLLSSRPVGVATWRRLSGGDREATRERLLTAGLRDAADEWDAATAGPKVGLASVSSLLPRAQGRGLGRELLEARWLAMRQAGLVSAVVHCWMHPGRRSFETYLRSGFTVLATVPGWWAHLWCPYCVTTCTCEAALITGAIPD